MSNISDYIAQRRLDLQAKSQSLNERKFSAEQERFHKKLQSDFENENRKNEANIQIATIQAQNNLELMMVQNLLGGLNETQKFFQSELAKQTAQQLELQKISHETQATSLLERLKNNAEINKIKLNAKLEIQRMIQAGEIQKEQLFFEKYCDLFFRLLERDLGLNAMNDNSEMIERYIKQAFDEIGLGE